MTIGERISHIRKDAHLSQEAFGETLGVTRQAISKWESNTSVPDVDKLILLSKTYDIPVGWILGVEDNIKNEDFSQNQLELIKEIVSQCGASSKTDDISKNPGKKRTGMIILAVAAVFAVFAIWCGNMFSRLSTLENSQDYLRNQVANVESSLSSQTYTLTKQIEDILNSQNSLLADFGYSIVSYDYANDTVVIEVYIIPKTYTEGMSVSFTALSDSISYSENGTEEENHLFKADITCKMSDSIKLSAAITKDDIIETAQITVLSNIKYETIPQLYFASGTNLWGSLSDVYLEDITNGGREEDIYLFEDMDFSAYTKNNVYLTDVTLFLIENDKILDSFSCIRSDDSTSHIDWHILFNFNYTLQEGDTFQYAAVAVDNYGRQHIFYDYRYKVTDNFVDYDDSFNLDGYYSGEDMYGLLDYNQPPKSGIE